MHSSQWMSAMPGESDTVFGKLTFCLFVSLFVICSDTTVAVVQNNSNICHILGLMQPLGSLTA